MEHESVFVPEVGFFKLHFKEAAFQQFMTKLNPPATQLQFDNTVHQTSTFADLLTLHGMDAYQAIATQSALISDYKKAQQSGNKFEMDYFGSFENETLNVTDHETFNKFRGLKELNITPLPVGIQNIRHEASFSSDIRGSVKTEKSSVSEQYLLPVLSILTVLFFIAYGLWQKQSASGNNVTDNQQTVVQIDSLPGSDTINDSDMTHFQPVTKTEIPMSSKEIEGDINQTDVVKQTNFQPRIVENPNKSVETTRQIAPSTVLRSTECVVITGSFKSQLNSNKLKKSLQNNGYRVYTEYFGGFHRVGIIFDCEKYNRDSFKLEIRQKINDGAWILGE